MTKIPIRFQQLGLIEKADLMRKRLEKFTEQMMSSKREDINKKRKVKKKLCGSKRVIRYLQDDCGGGCYATFIQTVYKRM
jgi:hypothetical protein